MVHSTIRHRPWPTETGLALSSQHLLLSWLPQRQTPTRLTSWFSWRDSYLVWPEIPDGWLDIRQTGNSLVSVADPKAALNQGGDAAVNSVSCAMAGNCAADGFYTNSSRHAQAFVVNERPSH